MVPTLIQGILIEQSNSSRSKLPGVNNTAIIIYSDFLFKQ
jgi:hypothetical protein